MNRIILSIGYLSIAGCATDPALFENDIIKQPAGMPWGVAWIPPNGDVAINAASIEYVLYPPAPSTGRRSGDPLSLGASTSTSESAAATATTAVPSSVDHPSPRQLSPTQPLIIPDADAFNLRVPGGSCPVDE